MSVLTFWSPTWKKSKGFLTILIHYFSPKSLFRKNITCFLTILIHYCFPKSLFGRKNHRFLHYFDSLFFSQITIWEKNHRFLDYLKSLFFKIHYFPHRKITKIIYFTLPHAVADRWLLTLCRQAFDTKVQDIIRHVWGVLFVAALATESLMFELAPMGQCNPSDQHSESSRTRRATKKCDATELLER